MYAFLLVLGFLVTYGGAQNPSKCAYQTSTTCGYLVSHEQANFKQANHICKFHDDSVLAGTTMVERLTKDGKMKWTGFNYSKNEGKWTWLDDGKTLDPSLVTQWRNQEVAEGKRCVAVSGVADSSISWHLLPCTFLLNESLCERPIRSNCHRWNFTYGCLWEDEKCEHRYEQMSHDSDDMNETCQQGTKKNLFRMPCEPEKCLNCKLSVWTAWTGCRAAECDQPGFRFRKRRILAHAVIGQSCDKFPFVEKKPCSVTCGTSAQPDVLIKETVSSENETVRSELTAKVAVMEHLILKGHFQNVSFVPPSESDAARTESVSTTIVRSLNNLTTTKVSHEIPNVTTLDKLPVNHAFVSKSGNAVLSLQNWKNLMSSTMLDESNPVASFNSVYVYISLSIVAFLLLTAMVTLIYYYYKSPRTERLSDNKERLPISVSTDSQSICLISIAVGSKTESSEVTRDVIVNLPPARSF